MTKKVVVIIIAALLLLGGGIAAIGGGVLMALFGTDSTLTSGVHRVSTPTSALVTALDDIKDANGFGTTVDKPTLRVSIPSADHPVFIGIGRAADVDGYLAGAAVDKVTDLDVDPFRLKTVRQDGTSRPAAPAEQTFWVARASGPNASLNWKISDGSYRLVVMNADATAAVGANGRFGLTIPHLFAIGVGVLVAGIVAALIGVTLLVIGVRMRPRSPIPPAGALVR
jgi:ribosomal protein L31